MSARSLRHLPGRPHWRQEPGARQEVSPESCMGSGLAEEGAGVTAHDPGTGGVISARFGQVGPCCDSHCDTSATWSPRAGISQNVRRTHPQPPRTLDWQKRAPGGREMAPVRTAKKFNT